MAGDRDTEIAIVAHQSGHVGPGRQNGAVFGFRMNLWIEHTGSLEAEWSAPESTGCVQRIRALSESNLQLYMQPPPVQIHSHLCAYPIYVDSIGNVSPRFLSFPDTDGSASIVGTESKMLPYMLTS